MKNPFRFEFLTLSPGRSAKFKSRRKITELGGGDQRWLNQGNRICGWCKKRAEVSVRNIHKPF